jgi:hypothetical protein
VYQGVKTEENLRNVALEPTGLNGTLDDFEDFLEWLTESASANQYIFRGESRIFPTLQSSLDRVLNGESCESDKLVREQTLIDRFRQNAFRFLGTIEKDYLSRHESDRVIQLTVMQHYGAPTRLLDWTHSVAAAAYFACIYDQSSDGVIWWLNSKQLEDYVDERWEGWGFTRLFQKMGLDERQLDDSPLGLSRNALRQVDYNERIFDLRCAPFVNTVYLSIAFPRAQAQRGLFTIASRLGMSHDSWLNDCFDGAGFGKTVIPAELKRHVIEYLYRLGIDAVSLQHTGADRVGLKMRWDVMQYLH